MDASITISSFEVYQTNTSLTTYTGWNAYNDTVNNRTYIQIPASANYTIQTYTFYLKVLASDPAQDRWAMANDTYEFTLNVYCKNNMNITQSNTS